MNLLFISQVVITYVAYLCARLLDLREETRAARCIQVAWRRFRLKRRLELKKVGCLKGLSHIRDRQLYLLEPSFACFLLSISHIMFLFAFGFSRMLRR